MTSRLEAKRGLHLPAAPEPKSKVASPLPAATATGEGTLDEVVVERAPLTVDTLPKRVIELFSMAMVVILFMLHNLLAKVCKPPAMLCSPSVTPPPSLPCVQTSLSVFSVYPTLINGHRHLQSDMTVSSADALFGPLVAGAVLSTLIYGFGIPSVAVFILIRRRNQLETDNQFKFLYDGYDQRRGRYLWEAVVLTRKVAVIAVAALIDDPFNQAFAGACMFRFGIKGVNLLMHPPPLSLDLRRSVSDAPGLVPSHPVSSLRVQGDEHAGRGVARLTAHHRDQCVMACGCVQVFGLD